ncbi:MAG: hypothetical protein ACRCWJ_23720, partial [Casimicrobium sp.]
SFAMPINTIDATTTVIATYSTFQAQHRVRFYLSAAVTPSAVDGELEFAIAGAPLAYDTVAKVLEAIRVRVGLLTNIRSWDGVEVLNTAPATNEFLGYSRTIQFDAGDGTAAVAAAYRMYVFGSPTRQQFRFTIMDASDARPQRYPSPLIPLADDGSLQWLFVRSGVPFSTQDGNQIARLVSINTGVNDALARAYGRRIQP